MTNDILLKDARDYIKLEFELRKSRRPAYSMRALARDLEISPSSLNDFMKGRVGMSRARILTIGEFLKWPETRIEHFADLIASKYDADSAARAAAALRLRKRFKTLEGSMSLEAFKAISDWYHLVILEICEIQDGVDVQRLAQDLELTATEVKEAIKRLQKLGFLQLTPEGLKPTEAVSHFGNGQPSESIVAFHSQILSMTQKVLHERPMMDRYNQSVVFSLRSADIEAMYAEIEKSVLGILNKYVESSDRDCVQVFSMHSFSVTKKGDLPL